MRLQFFRSQLLLIPLLCSQVGKAQEAEAGLHLPIQISINGLFSDRFDTTLPWSLANLEKSSRNSLSGAGGGVRVLLSPTLKFNRNWFAHATLNVNTEPFFPYQAYHVTRPLAQGRLVQGYLGYTRTGKNKSFTVKAGQLASAFGDFSRRYSDTANALIDAPQPYGSYLLLRPDELPCSNYDLQHQQRLHPNITAYHCSAKESYRYGIIPVSPYGVFGGELDVNAGRWDARLQVTNSSPSNPRTVLSRDQALQWAAGIGYSFKNGLRIGFSMFDGPWLQGAARAAAKKCPMGGRYCACGTGIDVQYARGRFSFSGEWMQIEYEYPGYIQSPKVTYAYGEGKVILSPRIYLASRIGRQSHNSVAVDRSLDHRVQNIVDLANDPSVKSLQPNKNAYELGLGVRPTRYTLFKVAQQWVQRNPSLGPKDSIFMVQMVNSLPDIWKSFERKTGRLNN